MILKENQRCCPAKLGSMVVGCESYYYFWEASVFSRLLAGVTVIGFLLELKGGPVLDERALPSCLCMRVAFAGFGSSI